MLEIAYNKISKALYLVISRNTVLNKEIYNAITEDVLGRLENSSNFKSIYLNITEDYCSEFNKVEEIALGHEYIVLILEIPNIDEIIEKRIFHILNIIKNRNIFLIISTRGISSDQKKSKWYGHLCKNGIVIYGNHYTHRSLNCALLAKAGCSTAKNSYPLLDTFYSSMCPIFKYRLLDKITCSNTGLDCDIGSLVNIKESLVVEDFSRTFLSKNKLIVHKKLEYFISLLGEGLVLSTLEKICRKILALSSRDLYRCYANRGDITLSRRDRAIFMLSINYKILKQTKKTCGRTKLDFSRSLTLFILEIFCNI